MKAITVMLTLAALLAAGLCPAAERTGREFSELIRDVNEELATAKQEVRKIAADHAQQSQRRPEEIRPERRQALEELEDITAQIDEAKDDATRQQLEAELEDKVLDVAEKSADFLEAYKGDLDVEDRQLGVVEDALANVIVKFGRLQQLTEDGDGAKSEAERHAETVRQRRELQTIARTVEMLAKANPDSTHWRGVRQTIMLQDALLKQNLSGNTKVADLLKHRQQVYEQTHAQIALARQGIAREKALVAQLAMNEVAKSTLRRAASILLGNHALEDIGVAAIERANERQGELLQFLRDDRQAEAEFDPANARADSPDGWDGFLAETIE